MTDQFTCPRTITVKSPFHHMCGQYIQQLQVILSNEYMILNFHKTCHTAPKKTK